MLYFIYPDFLKKLFGVFRAAGRFAWPLWYLLFAFAIAKVARDKNFALRTIIITIAILLQIYDLGNGIILNTWAKSYTLRQKKMNNCCLELEKLIKQKKKLAYTYQVETFAFPVYFAIKNNMVVEDFYFPRQIFHSKEKSTMSLLLEGKEIDKQSVYMMTEPEKNKILSAYPEYKKNIYLIGKKTYLLIPR